MDKIDQIDQRLSAVESTVVDGNVNLDDLSDVSELMEELERVNARLDELESRLSELEGVTQSLEGYVGNIRTVNEETEKQADAAMAAVDRLEKQIENFERQISVEAFEQMSQRIDKIEEEQQRLLSQANTGSSEFVFGVPEGTDSHKSETASLTSGTSTSEKSSQPPLDTSVGTNSDYDENHANTQLPSGQEEIADTYEKDTTLDSSNEDQDNEEANTDKRNYRDVIGWFDGFSSKN